jgi:hypothetical protein
MEKRLEGVMKLEFAKGILKASKGLFDGSVMIQTLYMMKYHEPIEVIVHEFQVPSERPDLAYVTWSRAGDVNEEKHSDLLMLQFVS